jgi:hypothetical protein
VPRALARTRAHSRGPTSKDSRRHWFVIMILTFDSNS